MRPRCAFLGVRLRGRVVCWLLAAAVLGGCWHRQYVRFRQGTGTCEGACDFYWECKQGGGEHERAACVAECKEIFTSPTTLAEFERLECAQAIGFVEGNSGRAPGSTVGSAAH